MINDHNGKKYLWSFQSINVFHFNCFRAMLNTCKTNKKIKYLIFVIYLWYIWKTLSIKICFVDEVQRLTHYIIFGQVTSLQKVSWDCNTRFFLSWNTDPHKKVGFYFQFATDRIYELMFGIIDIPQPSILVSLR